MQLATIHDIGLKISFLMTSYIQICLITTSTKCLVHHHWCYKFNDLMHKPLHQATQFDALNLSCTKPSHLCTSLHKLFFPNHVVIRSILHVANKKTSKINIKASTNAYSFVISNVATWSYVFFNSNTYEKNVKSDVKMHGIKFLCSKLWCNFMI
jgi:hypothetical protein